jgi:hypothetical protein
MAVAEAIACYGGLSWYEHAWLLDWGIAITNDRPEDDVEESP